MYDTLQHQKNQQKYDDMTCTKYVNVKLQFKNQGTVKHISCIFSDYNVIRLSFARISKSYKNTMRFECTVML